MSAPRKPRGTRQGDDEPRPAMVGVPVVVSMLARAFQALPGVGEKTAEKFAMHMALGDPKAAESFGAMCMSMAQMVGPCRSCGCLAARVPDATEDPLCDICGDPRRDVELLCVVARQQDMLAIERCGAMRGRYFVLGKLLDPLVGVLLTELPMARLMASSAGMREVFLALPASVAGSATALAVGRELTRGGAVRVTRIAMGIAHGSDLEYVDPVSMAAAIQGRNAIK